VQAISRELKRQGVSWTERERGRRTDMMAMLAEEFGVSQRINRQANLLVTPRMLRQMFEANKGLFVGPAAARLLQVRFPADQATAAAEAAALWRSNDTLTARELAARFPGAIALSEMEASELAPALASVGAFALAGPTGAVCDPMPASGALIVARVSAYQPTRNGNFYDEAVQQELRRLCEGRVRLEFRADAQQRAKARTVVWLSPIIR
jgi:hypothetical protein